MSQPTVRLNDYGQFGVAALKGAGIGGGPRNACLGVTWGVSLGEALSAPSAKAQLERVANAAMNKTEKAYSRHLDTLLRRGEIARWDFEPVTLRLGPDARYTPDFRIIMPDGTEVFDDTKALWKGNPAKGTKDRVGWKDDAKVKIRTAAELHPYIFRGACQVAPGVWKVETFGRSL